MRSGHYTTHYTCHERCAAHYPVRRYVGSPTRKSLKLFYIIYNYIIFVAIIELNGHQTLCTSNKVCVYRRFLFPCVCWVVYLWCTWLYCRGLCELLTSTWAPPWAPYQHYKSDYHCRPSEHCKARYLYKSDALGKGWYHILRRAILAVERENVKGQGGDGVSV